MPAVNASPLADLRRTRRARRLGDTEWFDVAYHVYLAAFLGGGGIIVLSGYVGDVALDDRGVARVFSEGPAYLGVIVAVAVAVGLRSGAEGGPLSVESADVRHVLLAPVSRRDALRRPYIQRARAMVGGGALLGGTAGLLAAQRLPGSGPAWTTSGAAFGACAGLVTTAVAVHAHAVRLPGWVATAGGGGICGWQLWAAVGGHTGPLDTLGDLGLWGYRQHPSDLVSGAVVLLVAVLGLADVGRMRVEQLDRRGDLVSQLRFAVTTQDLRTVVLLRRQLRQEQPRSRPIAVLPRIGTGPGFAVIRRSGQSMLRMPLGRLARVTALGGAAGVAAAMAARGTTPAVLVCGLLLFVMGLDLIEPLSQEVDHPDLTEALPVDPGWIHLRLLVGPAVVALLPALAGAVTCAVVDRDAAPAALALALPITWAGMTGSVVNAVRDDVLGGGGDSMLVPPEMAGMKNVAVTLIPLIVSSIGPAAILAVRTVPTTRVVAQFSIALCCYLVAFLWWVRKRTGLRESWARVKQEAMP